MLNLGNMTFLNILVTTFVSFMGEVITSIHLDTYSTTRRMYLLPVDDGKGPTKSTHHTSNTSTYNIGF